MALIGVLFFKQATITPYHEEGQKYYSCQKFQAIFLYPQAFNHKTSLQVQASHTFSSPQRQAYPQKVVNPSPQIGQERFPARPEIQISGVGQRSDGLLHESLLAKPLLSDGPEILPRVRPAGRLRGLAAVVPVLPPQKMMDLNYDNLNPMNYANFFSPQVISILFCLHESTVEGQQKDPHSEIIQFLIRKILSLTQSASICLTNETFEAELLSVTSSMDFVLKYRQCLERIKTFNDFYRELSKMLKTLRSVRNNKLEQGNLIDFLIRRMYIYFEKLDFKEIIQIHEQFTRYTNGEEVRTPQHDFMLTKSIEEVKFNLENYSPTTNPEELAKVVLELGEYDHTFKTSYLKSLLKSSSSAPIESVNEMHRYFDKSLGNLFQEKSEVSLMSNKINHCILSTAFINLKMHYLQECLQSISEGLRISQNNTDEQSINNCIIYFYKISQQLGKYEQQILLNEHAITHSLNLNNILLMVYSCLNYSFFEKKYNCSDPNIALMKNRNINWTDALHFSKKKIYSTFESNCKNIYHTYRNLLIPAFMSKLSTLAHLPELEPLFLNSYYNRKELLELEVYRQFRELTDLDDKIRRVFRYQKNRQQKLLYKELSELKEGEKQALSPLEIIKIRSTINQIKYDESSLIDSYNQSQKLVQFCQKYGFVKEELLRELVTILRVLIRNELYHDALVKVELALAHAVAQKQREYEVVCQLLKVQIYLRLEIHIEEAMTTLQTLEQSGQISPLRPSFRVVFFETKALLNQKLYDMLLPNINLYQQCQALKRNEFQNLEEILEIHLGDDNFVQVRATLLKIYDILLLNPTIISKAKNEKIKNTLSFCEKTLNNFAGLDHTAYDEQALLSRVSAKMRRLYHE